MNINVIEPIKNYRLEGRHVEIDGTTYDLEVRYALGGMNWFTSRVDPRGYLLCVTPVQRSRLPSGHVVTSFTAFTGYKIMLQPANRFSEQVLARLAYNIFRDMNESPKLIELIEAVIEKNKQCAN